MSTAMTTAPAPSPLRTSSRASARGLRSALLALLVGLLLALSGGVAAADPPIFGNAGDFVDTWRNVDPDTRDITRVVITPGAGIAPVKVKVYASCGASECAWQQVDGHWGSTGTDTIAAKVFSKNAQGYVFATRKVTLRLDGPSTLAYQLRTDYADPGRQDHVVSGYLDRT